jgi:hypothetical protein
VVGSGAGEVIAEKTPVAPGAFSLAQNYPNPFNPTTMISFTLAEPSYVRLEVFDVRGARVATLVDREMTAGGHTAEFNARGLSSGVYFYRLTAGNKTEMKKMVLLR